MVNLTGAVDVSRETFERLKAFETLVQKWSPKINLVSRDALSNLWQRHILDSAQIFQFITPGAGTWLDIGSGGGFPGIVAAIILAEVQPQAEIVMIESDQRKATFLRTALRDCGVSGKVIAKRIEDIPSYDAITLTARALAPVSDLLEYADRHLNENGIALLHKGRNYNQELDIARTKWSFDVVTHTSLTANDSAILELRNIQRAAAN